MKKKYLALLTLPALTLASCNSNYDPIALRNLALETVYGFQSITGVYSKYDVKGAGHVVEFDCDPKYSEDIDQKIDGAQSLFLQVPVYISVDNFYYQKSEEDPTMVGTFVDIRSMLSSNIDSNNKMQIEKTSDGGLHFYCRLLQKKDQPFYHVDADASISVTSRFSIDLYYSIYGLLTTEKIVSDRRSTTAKNKTIELEASYTYKL